MLVTNEPLKEARAAIEYLKNKKFMTSQEQWDYLSSVALLQASNLQALYNRVEDLESTLKDYLCEPLKEK